MTTPAIPTDTIKAAQAGDADAMWSIVSGHDGMFAAIVRQVAPRATREQREDYLQEARAALVERVRLYDTTADSALSTYAYAAVRRAVVTAQLADTCAVSIGAGTELIHVRRALAEAGGDTDAAYETLAAGPVRISRGTFVALAEALRQTDSLDAPVGDYEGDGLTLADIIADPSADVSDPWERRELAEWLLTQINHRESHTLRAHYGVGMPKTDDAATAAHLQVKPSTVRKTRERALNSCRTVAARYSISA